MNKSRDNAVDDTRRDSIDEVCGKGVVYVRAEETERKKEGKAENPCSLRLTSTELPSKRPSCPTLFALHSLPSRWVHFSKNFSFAHHTRQCAAYFFFFFFFFFFLC